MKMEGTQEEEFALHEMRGCTLNCLLHLLL